MDLCFDLFLINDGMNEEQNGISRTRHSVLLSERELEWNVVKQRMLFDGAAWNAGERARGAREGKK